MDSNLKVSGELNVHGRKRFNGILPLIMAVLVFLLSGCSLFESAEQRQEREMKELMEDSLDLLESMENEARQNEEEAETALANSVKNVSLNDTSCFSEDRAWVEYSVQTNSGMTVAGYALIDTKGQILWKSDPITEHNRLELFRDFEDGLAYFGRSHSEFSIIDSSGNITFTQEPGGYNIVGYGDGKFLVTQYVSDFDTNEWRVGAIDKDGNIVVPLRAYREPARDYGYADSEDSEDWGYIDIEEVPDTKEYGNNLDFTDVWACAYLGDDVFYLQLGYGVVLFNTGAQSVVSLDGSDEYYGELEYSEGLKFADGAYYNMAGELVIDFPDYREKRVYNCGSFKDGYAPMAIKGADGLWYYTVIDKAGSQTFEPRANFSNIYVCDNGYILAEWVYENSKSVTDFGEYPNSQCVSVLDTSGQILMTVIIPVNGDYSIDDENPISCGMLRLSLRYAGDVYIDVTDGSTIGQIGSYYAPTVIMHD